MNSCTETTIKFDVCNGLGKGAERKRKGAPSAEKEAKKEAEKESEKRAKSGKGAEKGAVALKRL